MHHLQSTISTESNFASEPLRCCVFACDVFNAFDDRSTKSTVSTGTLSPFLPLKYSFVDVSGNWKNILNRIKNVEKISKFIEFF